MYRSLRTIAITLIACTCFAADTPATPDAGPRSPAAVAAKTRYSASCKLAVATYYKSLIAADEAYVADLTAARQLALKRGATTADESHRIDTALLTANFALTMDHLVSTGTNGLQAWIIAARSFRYINNGDGHRVLDLLPDGKIGRNGAAWERRWTVRNINAREAIIISGNHGDLILTRDGEKTFRGSWPGVTVVLVPTWDAIPALPPG